MQPFHLIYRSTATRALNAAEMAALLRKAREFNKANRITGILLYTPGQYMQVLEGERQEVEALYASICRDERHRQVLCLTQGATPRRVFPTWSMGFLATSATEFDRLAGHVDPGRPIGQLRRLHSTGPGLLALLQEFAMAQIVQF
ncbi:BLUF domain-containing protein [Hymenobacter saemangeumensis]